MAKHYYRKSSFNSRKITKFISLLILATGLIIVGFIFFPLISYQIYFVSAFSGQEMASPIPKATVLNNSTISSLLSSASTNFFSGIDYSNAENWFPNIKFQKQAQKVETYTLSIPKLGLENAEVTTVDTDLAKHLVNYGGTAIPPNKGTAVIFGHSTLPQLYNPKDYKTIFANAHKLKVDDQILVKMADISYNYKVVSIFIVDPSDASIFEQNFNDSYLALITCTPPGTIWKRLIIRAKLEKI
jgi:sortase A